MFHHNKPLATITRLTGAILFLVLSCCSQVAAQGVTFPVREVSNKLDAAAMTGGTNVIRIYNDRRTEMLTNASYPATVKYKANHTIVKFGIDHGASLVPTAPYSYKLVYRIEGCPNMRDSLYTFSANDTLVVSYNPDSLTAYQDAQVRVYPKLYQAKVTIIQIYDITSGTPVPKTLPTANRNYFVEVSMQYQLYLKTHYVPSAMGLTAASAYDATRQTLNVSWNPSTVPYLGKVTPAMYELEWTYADNYDASGGALPIGSVRYDFRNNATRVLTDTLGYNIPIVYPRGYVIYRVRMVRVDSNLYKYPIYGPWSLGSGSGTVSSVAAASRYLVSVGHMGDTMNWNYTINFAEGGKFKHVQSYFDGMLKNRQTITRFNTNPGQILATETIYDYEGRPSITTLPAVISSSIFRYQRNFSISNTTGLPYQALDFDTKPAGCPDNTIIPPFRNNSPANRYYSTLNTDTGGMQRFVPQAEGYPFVHTRLSPGYSDRVDAQSGAGYALQINREHETINEYVNADQTDLNKHFGINAGISSFYNKTVIKDPNGQHSMVVKDYEGKQVMSSLIGAAVDTTKIAIMFNDEVPLNSKVREDRLAGGAANTIEGSYKIYDGSFYMDFSALTNIKYEYDFKPYTVCESPYLGLTVKGSYDYQIHDDCGREKVHKTGTIGATGVSTVADPPPFSSDTSLVLDKGKHTLKKVLTISEGDAEAAVDSFLNHTPTCLKTENQFIKEAIDRTKYPCPVLDECGALKKAMMEELFVYAKYGTFKITDKVYGNNPSIFDYSQFPGWGGDPTAYYRYQAPCVAVALDGLGLGALSDMAVTDFIDIYKLDANKYRIAEVLLPLHPEYCKLLNCFADTFAERLQAMPDAATAIKYGFFGLENLVQKDTLLRSKMMLPPFNKIYIKDSLRLVLGGNVRMDTLASQMAFCMNSDAQVFGDAKNFFRPDIIGLNFPNDRVRNYYFEKLRDFYLFNREKYVSMAKTGAGNNCPPCDSNIRMTLRKPALVTDTYKPDGTLDMGPDGLMGMFSDSMMTKFTDLFTPPGSGGSSSITDTSMIRKAADSAAAKVHIADSTLSYIAVDSITSKLVNCFANPVVTARFKDSLIALYLRGQVHNGVFLPEQVRKALTGSGIALSDLCHQWLASYDYFDEGSGGGSCASPTFYNAARDFFNTPAINALILASSTSLATNTPSWPATNLFAVRISSGITGGTGSIRMHTQYLAADSTYRFGFSRSGSDTLVLSIRCPRVRVGAGSPLPWFGPTGAGAAIVFNSVNCFFEDPAAMAEGHVGRYLFRASVTRTEVFTDTLRSTSLLLGWNNAKLMMNDAASNPIAGTVPCTQFRELYKAFADSMTLYGGYAADHPLFDRSLRNFMNYRLQKSFSPEQYRRFLASCALADSQRIPSYGGYARLSFPAGSYATFEAFADAMESSYGISPKYQVHYKIGSTQYVVLDYRTIPYNKMSWFASQVLSLGGTLKYTAPAGNAGMLWLPASVSVASVTAGTVFSADAGTAVQVKKSIFLPFLESYKRYTLSYSATTHKDMSRSTERVRQNLRDLELEGYWQPSQLATVNSDYYKATKQAFLQYVYKMQGLPAGKVLDTLQPLFLEANVPLLTGPSYRDPANPARFTDLFYADAANKYPQYDTVLRLLDYAKATLGGGKILNPAASNTVVVSSGIPAGYFLNLYRCADGLYWYRYFGKDLKLFNIYIRVPGFVPASQRPSLTLLGLQPMAGDTVSRNFKLLLKEPASGDTIYATGSADFDISWSSKLRDVLLGNESNTTVGLPPSGEPGADPNCEQELLAGNIYEGKTNYYDYITKYREKLVRAFKDHVMKQVAEKLWIEYIDMRFGTTLYSYDLANNLIQTVPPAGIRKLDTTMVKQIDSLRDNKLKIAGSLPNHRKATRYEYNTFNKPLREITPDAGTKVMFYDNKGNILLSQSQRQRQGTQSGLYTYFIYDAQNRLEETGEVLWSSNCLYFDPMPLYGRDGSYVWKTNKPNSCACENLVDSVWEFCDPGFNMTFYNDTAFNNQVRSKTRSQVVYTIYDSAFTDLSTKAGMSRQENLRSRIAANMYYLNVGIGRPGSVYEHATHYSYDAAGNVKTLVQDFPQLENMKQRYKRIDYEYDLWSGKVNQIGYNRGYADQLFQRYSYDADNRITKAETSRDGFIWKRDAEYTYYQHGPLARVSLGDQRVQGIDYAYTLQGWLKAINGDNTDTTSDLGGDGKRNTITPRDVYASVIDYFPNDYKAIAKTPVSRQATTIKGLYNGNIARQSADVAPFGSITAAYTYDQMNRIRAAKYAPTTTNGAALAFNNWYASSYKYDLDGNIRNLVRRQGSGTLMDSLRYAYSDTQRHNKLADVLDFASHTVPGVEDMKYYTATGYSRMLYDADGNTVKDLTSGTDTIRWNIYGKATDMQNRSSGLNLYFGYDAMGHRTYKKNTKYTDSGSVERSTFYVREASGNILAEYNTLRELDKGGLIPIIDIFRGTLTGTGTKVTWVTALHSLGYTLDPDFAGYVVAHSGPVTPYAAGYYLANDPMLAQSFVYSGAGVLPAISRYGASVGEYPVADAIRLSLSPNTATQTINSLASPLFSNPDPMMKQHSLVQLAETLPQLYAQIAQNNQITLNTPQDSINLMQAMINTSINNPGYFGSQMSNYYMQDPTSLDNWLNAISSDSLYTLGGWYQQMGFINKLQNSLVQFGDAAANIKASIKGTSKQAEGLFGFASWWPGGIGVVQSLSQQLPMVSYYADPVAYLTGLTSYAVMDTALTRVTAVDIGSLATTLSIDVAQVFNTRELSIAPAVKQQEIRLGNHHLYGSSRLGIAQYWPNQFRNSWDFRSGLYDTTVLNIPASWYSAEQNDVISKGSLEAYGNSLAHSMVSQHLLGQKQYELTNHLQNVQSTVSDKRFVKVTGANIRDYFNASIKAAYDYYPFGQLMPGRFVSDTTPQCVTVNKTVLLPKKTSVNLLTSFIATPVSPATLSSSMSGITVYGQGGGFSYTIPVTAGVPITVSVSIGYLYASFLNVGISEKVLGVPKMLGNVRIGAPASHLVTVTPTTTSMTIRIEIMSSFVTAPFSGLFRCDYLGYEQVSYQPENVAVQICTEDKDKYEFGYNGQMKVNEVAGVGNWNTAQFWEYDTRTATRKNPDPVVNASMSIFAVFDGNPIAKNDVLGNTPGSGEKKSIDEEAAKEKAKYDQGGESEKSKPNTSFFMARFGGTGGPFKHDGGPTTIWSIYGGKQHYNTQLWTKRSFPLAFDEPNSFVQFQFRILGPNSNVQLSVNWFKQKYDGKDGFKIEAPTASHFSLGQNFRLGSMMNNTFKVSANYSIGGGPEWGKLIDNGAEGRYQRIGWGGSVIGRIDVTYLKRATFFIAGTLHHLQTDQQNTSTGKHPSESVGSFGISAGAGFNLGKQED